MSLSFHQCFFYENKKGTKCGNFLTKRRYFRIKHFSLQGIKHLNRVLSVLGLQSGMTNMNIDFFMLQIDRMGLAASYAGRLGLTAWRRKSTLLGMAAGVVLLVLCLQYNASSRPDSAVKPEDNLQGTTAANDDKSPLQRTLRNHQEGRSGDTVARVSNDRLHRVRDPEEGGNLIDDGADGLKHSIGGENVKFVQAEDKQAIVTASYETMAEKHQRIPMEQPAREEVAVRKATVEQLDGEVERAAVEVSTSGPQPLLQYNSYDQQGLYQMGIPYVSLDQKKPYVPEQRLVHFDLKGAPPKVSRL